MLLLRNAGAMDLTLSNAGREANTSETQSESTELIREGMEEIVRSIMDCWLDVGESNAVEDSGCVDLT